MSSIVFNILIEILRAYQATNANMTHLERGLVRRFKNFKGVDRCDGK